jgi:FkbM family methyltransferase
MARPRWLFDALVRLTGNERAQRFLWSSLNLASDLLGIGPGGFRTSSGEAALVDMLQEDHRRSEADLCIFDVGAHEGEFLDTILPPLTDRGTPFVLHAFEPSAPSFERIQFRHGMRRNIHLNNLAMGRQSGERDLYANAPGSSLSSFSRRRLDHFGMEFDHTERVSVCTLDEYCADHSIEHIDLLKLDVEGHELDVLQGGSGMLAARRVGLVTFEFGGCNIDSRTYFQDYWYFVQHNRVGDIFRLTPSGYAAPVTAYNELYEQFRPTNYLVVCSST